MDPTLQQAGRTEFVTAGGVRVNRVAEPFDPVVMSGIAAKVDHRRGGVLSSGMEYPGRYSRWHMAYVDPCAEIIARGQVITARALNDRGHVLLPVLGAALLRAGTPVAPDAGEPAVPGAGAGSGPGEVTVRIPEPSGTVPEEERSRRPTVFSALREIAADLGSDDPNLGLYGAFGYDLAFQFEPVTLRHQRPVSQRDLVLHLPDELYMVDRKRETAFRYSYDFEAGTALQAGAGDRTHGLPRVTADTPPPPPRPRDVPPQPVRGSYARIVEEARARFVRGDLFEVVPSQVFHRECHSPAAFYERLRTRNPAPYEFFFNLGEGEYLVGASPEMFVRVTGDRVETCPIAGTIARGGNPLEDAANIRALLDSPKEESELTMCTDVDRNDKARICMAGSVKVIGRRQIEMYSRLIHTVDHIEGRLRPGYDALDAFLTHMWAVTVTGAPKTWAMQFIEDHEDGPRRWYGGAVGKIGFDGSLNTGLTLRTAHITGGIAAVRVGATLLYESEPEAEERETELKARALLETLAAAPESGDDAKRLPRSAPISETGSALAGDGLTVLLVDHQDSFVNTLADYFRQQGARVTTLRAGFDTALLDEIGPDLVVLSPGPGWPSDFGCEALLKELDARGLAAFGVCLGLQAMVEHTGGTLGLLPRPVHGKPGRVRRCVDEGESSLLDGLPAEFTAARYHSVHAMPPQVRGGFLVTAVAEDGAVMAIEDANAGKWAVQFHPESILTTEGRAGHQVIENVLRLCRTRSRSAAVHPPAAPSAS
ncbi:MAG: anthranilate synthase component I [Micromonosporaceae bacterium]